MEGGSTRMGTGMGMGMGPPGSSTVAVQATNDDATASKLCVPATLRCIFWLSCPHGVAHL
jgi:hypothetical protein